MTHSTSRGALGVYDQILEVPGAVPRSRNKIPRKERIFREASRCPSGTQALSCRRERKCSWTCLQSHPLQAGHLQLGQGVTAGGQSLRQGPFSPVLWKQMERADRLLITLAHLWEATPQGRSLLLTASPLFQPSSRRQAGPSQLSRPPCQGASLTRSQRTQMPRPPLLQACFSGTEANPWLHTPGSDWRGDSVIEVRAPHTPTQLMAEKMYHLYR